MVEIPNMRNDRKITQEVTKLRKVKYNYKLEEELKEGDKLDNGRNSELYRSL